MRWIAAISILFVIAWNYFANSSMVYEVSVKDVSDKYINLFTPTGFTFAIWGVIYLGMIAVAISLFTGSKTLPAHISKFSLWIIAQSAFNSLWIHFFLSDRPVLAFIEIVLLLVSLVVLLQVVSGDKQIAKWMKAVIGIYAGWVTAATIANATIVFMAIEWIPLNLEAVLWYKIMLLIAAIIGLAAYRKWQNVFFPISVVWALFGIGYSHLNNNSLMYWAFIPAAALLLIVLVLSAKNKKMIA